MVPHGREGKSPRPTRRRCRSSTSTSRRSWRACPAGQVAPKVLRPELAAHARQDAAGEQWVLSCARRTAASQDPSMAKRLDLTPSRKCTRGSAQATSGQSACASVQRARRLAHCGRVRVVRAPLVCNRPQRGRGDDIQGPFTPTRFRRGLPTASFTGTIATQRRHATTRMRQTGIF